MNVVSLFFDRLKTMKRVRRIRVTTDKMGRFFLLYRSPLSEVGQIQAVSKTLLSCLQTHNINDTQLPATVSIICFKGFMMF